MNSSAILDQGSTSNGRDLTPYWNGQVVKWSQIVVTHCDQLCRFAFDLIQYILSLHIIKLVVLFDDVTSDEYKFSQDILAINTVFICQMQGRKAAIQRQVRKKAQDKDQDNISTQQATTLGNHFQLYIANQSIFKSLSKAAIKMLDGLDEICL
jgi:hypothetical protein